MDREANNSNANGNHFENTERTLSERVERGEPEPFDINTIPPVLFLTRPDFFTVLHTNTDAMEVYNRNPSLKHMISRVRRNPLTFPRYEHNRDLVALINFFADPNKELPRGYESKLDRTGKVSFLILPATPRVATPILFSAMLLYTAIVSVMSFCNQMKL